MFDQFHHDHMTDRIDYLTRDRDNWKDAAGQCRDALADILHLIRDTDPKDLAAAIATRIEPINPEGLLDAYGEAAEKIKQRERLEKELADQQARAERVRVELAKLTAEGE